MENPESKTEIDELKQPTKSKRRISSILKAPRTPLKTIGTDNEDCQEETAKPIEKKRKSRRVSFASTNDIHVFVKDFKNGSSFENLLQDLSGSGEETLDNTGIHMVKERGQQLIGMETLLNAPLHASQHQNKENIFVYGAENDFCDKTVVFSEEDTAFMDMTQSHTIIIDNKEETDAAMSTCGNIEFTSAVGGAKASGFDDSRKEGTVFESCSTSGKGPIKESDLEDFLASLTQSSGSGRLSNIQSTSSATSFTRVPSPAPKVDAKKFFAKLRAHRSAVNHENQVPVATRKYAHQDESSQQRSHCLSERTMILEQENMDLTKTHTAIIGDEGLFQRKSFALSGEQEDMEMTRSQTVVIDPGLSMLVPNKTVMFSEADHDVEMTGLFTRGIEETHNPSTKRDEMVKWLFPAANTISHLSQFYRMEQPHTQIDTNVFNCLLPASSDPKDMEMTRSQNVVIDSKKFPMKNSSLSNVRNASCLSAPNKTIVFSEEDHNMEMTGVFTGHIEENRNASTKRNEMTSRLFPTTNAIHHTGDAGDMDITRSQTVVIDAENFPIKNSSLSNVRNASCLLAPNKTIVFSEEDHNMEMTGVFTGHIEENRNASTIRNETTSRLFPTTNAVDHTGDAADMEIKRSQTVGIDSKNFPMKNSSLSNVRNASCLLAPNKTIVFSEEDHNVEMTGVFTGHIEENRNASTKINETTSRLFPTTNAIDHTGDAADMEMTRCQTVVIDSKNFPMKNSSLSNVRNASCLLAPNKTIVFSEEDHNMEMTGVFTGHIEENRNASTKINETTSRLFPTTNAVDHTGDAADMEITRSQTVGIDAENVPMKNSSLSNVRNASCLLAPNKTIVFSEEDHNIEMTGIFTGHIEENRNASTKRNETTSRLFPTTNAVDHTGDADDMEMTRCQTVVIDSKNFPMKNSSLSNVRNASCLSAPNKTIVFSEEDHNMEMTGVFTGHIEENRNASTKRNETTSRLFPTTNAVDHTGNAADMEITRSQTVGIDAENVPMKNSSLSNVRNASCLSAPNKSIVFSEEDHNIEMTGVFTGHIEENRIASAKRNETTSRLFPTTNAIHHTGDAADMEITRSQTVVIDAKNFPMKNSSLSNVRNASCLLAPNKTIVFSEEDHNMEMTGVFTGHIEENRNASTKRNETTSRLFPTTIAVDHTGDADDMEMTRRQTVVIDSENCPTNPSFGKVRRVSCLSPPNKAIVFSEVDNDMEMTDAFPGNNVENTRISTGGNSMLDRLSTAKKKNECNRVWDATFEKSNVYCGSDFNETQLSSEEDNGLGMIKTHAGHSVKSNHKDGDEAEISFPSDKAKSTIINIQLASGSGSTSEAASSEGVENVKKPSVCIITRNGEMVNSSTCIMSKGPLLDSSKTQFFSETDDMAADENTPARADEVESQVCSLPTTNSVPPPCIPNCQTVVEGNTGQCDQIAFEGTTLMSADLTSLGEMSCNAPLVNYTLINDEERSCKTNANNLLATDSSGIGHDGKETEKQPESRQMTLADFQSKLQNIGLMITEKYDFEKGCHTVPQLTSASSPKARETTEPKVHSGAEDHSSSANLCMKTDHSKLDRQTNRTETFKLLNSKSWTTQLFAGGVVPKLPRRSVPLNLNREDLTGHRDIRMLPSKSKVGVAEKDGDLGEVKNINEETLPEISSEEDLSETVERNIPRDRDQEASVSRAVVDAETIQNVTQGQKRPFPVDGHECDMPEERKMRSLTISSQKPEPSRNVQWDGNAVGIVQENPPSFLTLESTNFSSGTPNQRSEGTFEMSGHRISQYDIQFDDPHQINFQQKLEDGSITVRDFLKLFGIDFNINKPRQSVLSENFETNSEPNLAEVLREKHINRPKQRLYEEDCQELTDMVEKLKTRMGDQDKSLKTTNEALWEVVKTFSEEQLQSFGTKLKERKVYFRKQCKSLSQESKIGLCSKLVHTTQVSEQNLTEKIEDMDELLKHLDECINDLQADLSSMDCAGVEEYSANSETKLSLEVKQQELESLNMVLTDNERRVCELELEKNSVMSKVRKLQAETVELEKQITILHRMTEWKLSEITDDSTVFSFLYDSMGLEVLFEKTADKTMTGVETEQKVEDIKFRLELNEETSLCYAPLVHNLLRQFIQNESSWTQRYPTSRHIPALLHDVSLVVGRCRLLGEEIHRLLKWGSLSLDILEIGCVDTQVRILFSSLKAVAKFELTLAVRPAYPFAALQLVNFQNYIGNTRIDQVEEIIAAEPLANNYLTRIVKRIHNILLC